MPVKPTKIKKTDEEPAAPLEALDKLDADVAKSAAGMSRPEAKLLVDSYYTHQEYRKSAANKQRSLESEDEPHAVIKWLGKSEHHIENILKKVLGIWAKDHPVGAWNISLHGFGPVISAALLAYIDIHRASTVGAIWRFAGVDGSRVWRGREWAHKLVEDHVSKRQIITPEILAEICEKAKRRPALLRDQAEKLGKGKMTRTSLAKALARRPWNGDLKLLVYKIGDCIMKHKAKSFYGPIYDDRKAYEQRKNESGDYTDQAAQKLRDFKIGKETEAYKWYEKGMLPPGHIDQRAQRYAAKFFLSHWHFVHYVIEFGRVPVAPYVIEHLGHTHYIAPPNFDPVPFLTDDKDRKEWERLLGMVQAA